MKNAVLIGGLCAAIAFSAPAFAQGFQPAPADGGQQAGQQQGAGGPTIPSQNQLQQQLLEQAQSQVMSMTPEQRAQMIQQAQQRVQNMTPEQRAQLLDAAKQKMDSISPEERDKLFEEAKQRFEALSPQEQDQMKQKAADALKNVPASDKAWYMNGGKEPDPADTQQPDGGQPDGGQPQQGQPQGTDPQQQPQPGQQ